MGHNGVVVSTPEFQSSGPRLLPGRGEHNLLFDVGMVNLMLKKVEERQKA